MFSMKLSTSSDGPSDMDISVQTTDIEISVEPSVVEDQKTAATGSQIAANPVAGIPVSDQRAIVKAANSHLQMQMSMRMASSTTPSSHKFSVQVYTSSASSVRVYAEHEYKQSLSILKEVGFLNAKVSEKRNGKGKKVQAVPRVTAEILSLARERDLEKLRAIRERELVRIAAEQDLEKQRTIDLCKFNKEWAIRNSAPKPTGRKP